MYARRSHRSEKRRRQVYLRKSALCFMAVIIIASLSISFGNSLVAAHGDMENNPVEHKYYKSIEISYGDTLWGIAEKYMTDHYDSIYEYIYELERINNLDSVDDIHASQYLTVVYYDTEFQ